MSVKGAKNVQRNMKALVNKIAVPMSEMTMAKVLIIGRSHSDRLTPVQFGNLINSGYRKTERSLGGWTGMVGYTAEYAEWVHESSGRLKGKRRPDKGGIDQGFYWSPDGEPEFLRLGFERDGIDQIRKTILKGYKI